MLLLVFSTLFLATAVYLAGQVVTQPGRERHDALRRAATYGRRRVTGTGLERLRFHERVVKPGTASLARMVLRLNPRLTMEATAARLLAAGMGRSITPTAFLAAKGAGLVVGGVVGFPLGVAAGGPSMALLAAGGMAVFGFLAPGVVVSMRGRRRREVLKAQLPDALDLLAVSVEAGLGFDGAVAKLTEHMDGPLVEEFALTLGVASFSRAIIQADQLGISLGRILRLQATDSRLKRQAAAEERAMKSPIKMLFPTVLFIFPAMFIVILGPAMLNLMELF